MLQVVNIAKSYGNTRVLNDITATVDRGSFTTILGPSGSGKSTLLMSIAGFTNPSSGDILLEGSSILKKPPEQRNFGIVFQGYALFPHLKVWENVAFPLKLRKLPRSVIEVKVREVLERVRLQNFENRFPQELSGGQQQRVALARSLVFDPDLILLDEPLSALDKSLREELREELRRLHRSLGMTFILVTHDQEEALDLSDRIAIINHGHLEQLDTPSGVYERPANRFVAGFLGASNFLEINRVAQNSDGTLTLEIEGNKFHFIGKLPPTGVAKALMLRPEALRVGGPDSAISSNQIQGAVADISYRGPTTIISVKTTIGLLTSFAPSEGSRFNLGDSIQLHWKADAGTLLAD